MAMLNFRVYFQRVPGRRRFTERVSDLQTSVGDYSSHMPEVLPSPAEMPSCISTISRSDRDLRGAREFGSLSSDGRLSWVRSLMKIRQINIIRVVIVCVEVVKWNPLIG